jgi:hypothetical protein
VVTEEVERVWHMCGHRRRFGYGRFQLPVLRLNHWLKMLALLLLGQILMGKRRAIAHTGILLPSVQNAIFPSHRRTIISCHSGKEIMYWYSCVADPTCLQRAMLIRAQKHNGTLHVAHSEKN